MLDHLPWIVAGLAVGVFVGYAFGKYKGASAASGERPNGLAPGHAPQVGQPSAGADPDSAITVYIRRGGGNHYHKEGCRHLRNRAQAMTKAEAVRKGFRSCPKCRP